MFRVFNEAFWTNCNSSSKYSNVDSFQGDEGNMYEYVLLAKHHTLKRIDQEGFELHAFLIMHLIEEST
jgi:hypothetical protein